MPKPPTPNQMDSKDDQVLAGSTTQDNIGVLDIGNEDLDQDNPTLGDKTSGESKGEGSGKDGDKSEAKPGDKTADDKKGAGKDAANPSEETPVKYQGKTAEELLSILKDGETFQGKQSSEIGELRDALKALTEQNQALVKQLSGNGKDAHGGEQTGDPFKAKMAELEAALDGGQITPAEFSKALSALNEARTQQIVTDSLAQNQKQLADQAATQQFLEMNPDFEDMRTKGVLDKIKAQFPVHDNVSAYEFAKRLELQVENQGLKKQLAELKQAQADAIAAGRDGTKKVLQQPGTGNKTAAPTKRKGRFSETDAVDSMLGAIQRTRES